MLLCSVFCACLGGVGGLFLDPQRRNHWWKEQFEPPWYHCEIISDFFAWEYEIQRQVQYLYRWRKALNKTLDKIHVPRVQIVITSLRIHWHYHVFKQKHKHDQIRYHSHDCLQNSPDNQLSMTNFINKWTWENQKNQCNLPICTDSRGFNCLRTETLVIAGLHNEHGYSSHL